MASAMNCAVRVGVMSPAPFQHLIRAVSTSARYQYPSATMTKEATQERVKSIKEAPGPPHWPLLGCAPHMIYKQITGEFDGKKVVEFFRGMVEKYGPTFRMENPLVPKMAVVTRPEDCEAMVRATMDNPTRDGFTSLKKIRVEAVDDYFEGKAGILTENGEEWWRVRSRAQTPMMRSKNVAAYITRMDEVTLDFMDRMAWLQDQYGEMPSDFQTELYKWALESVGLVVLNRRVGCLAADLPTDSEPMQLIQLVNGLFESLNKVEMENQLWKIIPTKDFKELKIKHEEFLRIAERHIIESEVALREQGEDVDRDLTLLETLMLTPGLTRKDVLTLALDMLFAGIDTTSHTLGFTLYLLARNPKAQARLQQEVDRVLGDLHGPITSHHLAQLSYLKAVIKESLRIFPLVTGMGRSLDYDLVLGGYLVPKGWMVFSFNAMMGWDESLFPRAKEFLPERWLRDKPLGPIHPYASLPFGAGTRMCIGRRIAEQEMYIFLARAMQRFNVDYRYEDMGIINRLVSIPSLPLKFNITERRK